MLAAPRLRHRAAWFCLAVAAVAGQAMGASDPADARVARIDRFFAQLHEAGWFSGAVVVAERGQVLYEKGFGMANHELSVPFTPATASDGGSLAKTITAAALLDLVAEGRIDLAAPVRRYLPEFPYPEIRVRHLLAHANGLPDYDYFDAVMAKDAVRTTSGLLAVLAERKPALRVVPGADFQYSSLGYDVAALVVERVSGQPFGEFIGERFLRPLRMDSLFLRPARFADWAGPRTRGYRRGPTGVEPWEVFDLEGFHGGSNLYFSVRDLHRWNEAFARNDAVLVRARAAAGNGRAQLDDGRATGLTWLNWYESPDATAQWYSGALHAFYSLAYREDPHGRTISYMSNHDTPAWLRPRIVRIVATLLDGREAPPFEEPARHEFRRGGRAPWAGSYEVAEVGRVEIAMSPERATCRAPSGTVYEMFLVAPGIHYVPGLDAWIWFDRTRGDLHWENVLGGFVGRRQ